MNNQRYNRQILLPQIGETGQARISSARVLLVGCGALGTVIAEQLVRAGVGFLRLIDRDIVELSNLQRQVLFDESDARQGLPKAIAAERRLRGINSLVTIDARAIDAHSRNIEELLLAEGALVDLILDGTDNVGTRYLLNDVAVKHRVPWVYGACVGTEGRVMSIRPGFTACLRCVFPNPPEPGELPSCDIAGVLGSVAAIVGSLQVIAAITLLLDPASGGELIRLDGWNGQFTTIQTRDARRPDCPCCVKHEYFFLSAREDGLVQLCGRDAVQVRPERDGVAVSFDDVERRLNRVAKVTRNRYLLRAELDDDPSIRFTLFPDGRLIVQGTSDIARARSIYARYVGA